MVLGLGTGRAFCVLFRDLLLIMDVWMIGFVDDFFFFCSLA